MRFGIRFNDPFGPVRRPLTGLREAVVILRRLLAGDVVSFDGTVFRGWGPGAQLRGAVPVDSIPIYIGGQGPRVIRLMGELGDGALPLIFPPTYLPQVMAWIGEGAAAAGRPVRAMDVAPCFWFALADDHRAAEDAMRRMINSYGHYLRDELRTLVGLSHQDFMPLGEAWASGDHAHAAAMVHGRMFDLAILGTADEVAARLEGLIAQGVTHVNVGPPLGPDPRRSAACCHEAFVCALVGVASALGQGHPLRTHFAAGAGVQRGTWCAPISPPSAVCGGTSPRGVEWVH
jgi:5,10-methylenetetrahydromethanopterin reductase